MQKTRQAPLYQRIRQILESARKNVARSVNTTQVVANWLVGREIVEEEQKGKRRARYGERLLEDLSARLTADYGQETGDILIFWDVQATRDKASLDIFWLRDESLEESDHLPDPDVLAQEIVGSRPPEVCLVNEYKSLTRSLEV